MEYFSLKEAAQIAGLSKVTLWRLVQKGDLQAHKEEHQGKERYLIEAETFHNWLETFQGVSHPSRMQGVNHLDFTEKHPAPPYQVLQAPPGNGDEAPSESFPPPLETIEMIPADIHRLALEALRNNAALTKQSYERAERAERQLEGLNNQLGQYRQALSEQAESLAEKESRHKHLESLAEENARRIQQHEETHQQMLEDLRLSKQRIDWLEKRVPKWIRRMLGAG